MLGRVVGERYKLIYFLGGGGFGHAYLAKYQDSSEESWCLVKQMSLGNPLSSMNQEERIRRFKQEAETLKILGQHNRIPSLHDYFEENGQFYLVEDFIDGHELAQELNEFRFSEYEIYRLLQDILETLSFIQDKNIIHRDLSPDNLIRRGKDGRIVFIDFGAVKQVLFDSDGNLYRSHTISIGKNVYMPPEQASGRPQLCSDIYAVGIVGIQACIGDIPEQDYDSGELIWRHKALISSDFANILDKMTCQNCRQRYQKAAEALNDLNGLFSTTEDSSTCKIYKLNYASIWYKKGNETRNKGLHEEAILLYKKAIQIKEDHYKAWFNIGITFTYLKKYEDAICCLDKALVAKPKSGEVFLHKAIVLYALERPTEAIQSFQTALSLKENNKFTRIYRYYADLLNLDAEGF